MANPNKRKATMEKKKLELLEQYRSKTPEGLLQEYGVVFYTPHDVEIINRSINRIKKVLEKYGAIRDGK